MEGLGKERWVRDNQSKEDESLPKISFRQLQASLRRSQLSLVVPVTAVPPTL